MNETEGVPGFSDKAARCTTDGQPPRPGFENASAPAPIDPATGQHEAYYVLCAGERAKGFVRPVRRTYIHVGVGGSEIDPKDMAKSGLVPPGCGVATTMGLALAETYARNPTYYGATFCAGCRDHFPVGENGQFVWEDGTKVGT